MNAFANARRALLSAFVPALVGLSLNVPANAIDLDNGNAPFEVVIQNVAPFVFSDISPSGGDATLVLRVTTLITNAWFDAAAPYHPTAVGVYSRLGRRPSAESATNRNINIAVLHASYHVLNSVLPKRNPQWRAMLIGEGLNPDDLSENNTTPVGIGNSAGKAVVAFREKDGMNQLGDAGGRTYNRQPFADYTNYQPINTATDLKDPSRWQPSIISLGNGLFRIQKGVTPQFRLTRPYSYPTPNAFNSPRPQASDPRGPGGIQAYRAQADEVLAVSANLTDRQKMTAELFNDKIRSLGFSAVFAAISRGLSLHGFIQLDFLTNLAAFDTGIAIWNEKYKWDAVRPFSAIAHLYGNQPVRAWGGPGKGTVNDIPASHWRSYLDVADHPEYPSGSASFCGAHAQSARRYLGDDLLNWAVPAPMGSSLIEPGITPAANITLGHWATWTQFETECAESRVWGGVHFRASLNAGRDIGRSIGDIAFEYLKKHIDGTAGPVPTP
jgi:hypothetical protein